MKTYGKYYVDGEHKDIDEFHMHELLDRVHVLRDMFAGHIEDHPAAALFEEEIKGIADKLDVLYNNIGRKYL